MEKRSLKSNDNSTVEKLINFLDDERIMFDFERRLSVIRYKIDKDKEVKNVR